MRVEPLRFPKGMLLDERQLYLWVQAALGVNVPFISVCPGHCSPWDVFRDAYYATYPVMVVKASRGLGGKSFNMSTLGVTEGATLGAEVNLLGGSGQQSKRVLDTMDDLWRYDSAPRELIASETQHTKKLANGGSITALMASQASVRGPHPQRLRIDEADEMDIALLDAALGQPLTKNGIQSQTLISSTHQHADGTMTECLRRAGRLGWRVYEYCYQETLAPHGWLDPQEIVRLRATVPEQMWLTEYEGQEPNPEARAIDPKAVERAFRRDLGFYHGRDSEYVEIEPPVPGGRYSHGADWARKVDRTVITTLRTDVRPARFVAFEAMRRVNWPHMVERFDVRIKRYGGKACHDQTGIGDVVHGIMRSDAEGVMLVGRERQDVVSDYINAFERGEVEWPYIEQAYHEHKYASQDDVYAGGGGHLPDTMCAAALAYKAGFKRLTAAWASA